MTDRTDTTRQVIPRAASTAGVSARKKAAASKATPGHSVERVPVVKTPVKNRKTSSSRGLKHTSRTRASAAASASLADALVVPVTRPPQGRVREVADLVARGSEITIVQGSSSVRVSGETLAAFRQLLAALSAGPLSLVMGDKIDTELTSQEAADLLNVSRPHVVKLAREGRLSHKLVGNRHRFLLSDVQEFDRLSRLEREDALTAIAPEAGYSPEDF
jgi:excisionase family DNA binding protein